MFGNGHCVGYYPPNSTVQIFPSARIVRYDGLTDLTTYNYIPNVTEGKTVNFRCKLTIRALQYEFRMVPIKSTISIHIRKKIRSYVINLDQLKFSYVLITTP